MNFLHKLKIGKQAEREACRFLQTQGLHLLIQNYRCPQGEIDLIMQDKNDIVFVEVRSRSRIDFGNAIETVNLSKQKKLIKTALHFLQKERCLFKIHSRFDVMGIHYLEGKSHIEWVKNAFCMEYKNAR